MAFRWGASELRPTSWLASARHASRQTSGQRRRAGVAHLAATSKGASTDGHDGTRKGGDGGGRAAQSCADRAAHHS